MKSHNERWARDGIDFLVAAVTTVLAFFIAVFILSTPVLWHQFVAGFGLVIVLYFREAAKG